jgi:hypothetical protein
MGSWQALFITGLVRRRTAPAQTRAYVGTEERLISEEDG